MVCAASVATSLWKNSTAGTPHQRAASMAAQANRYGSPASITSGRCEAISRAAAARRQGTR